MQDRPRDQPDTAGAPDEEPSGTTAPGGWDSYAGFADITAAATTVLEQLRRQLGLAWWAVTRITGGTSVVLATAETGFPTGVEEPMPWADTLCRVVLRERTSRFVSDVRAAPALTGSPLVEQGHVGAYLSVPLSLDGAALFGTLCAVHPEPLPAELASQLPLVELQARLLSTLLGAALQLDAARRRAERAEADALLDPLTGLVNRRGWQMLLDREEQRCRRYGTVASVLVVDLDGLKAVNDRSGHAAGDALLQRAARVLREAFRSTDVAARLGGDEFAVLAIETDASAARQERDRLQHLFHAADLPASIGVATRQPTSGLAGAWTAADAQMYQIKHAKPGRAAPTAPSA